MKLRHDPLFIPKDGSDPFVNCKLDRKKYAEVLTSIVESYADGFVLAINNAWGEGKTTFVEMWQQHLKNNDFKTLYYNAWENDFENDVLVALISELGEIEDKPEKEFKVVLKKVLPLLGKVLPSILKHLAKRKLGDDAAADIAEALGDYSADQLKEATEKYTTRKKSIQEFKTSLENFAKKAGDGKPIVFIVDELDRCRPNYAVEVLEQIKHLFSVPGIVFVLSIDKEQLSNAVRGVYGSDLINADEYLRRFIDLEYSIPKPSVMQFIQYLYSYYDFDSFINDKKRTQYDEFRNDSDRLQAIGHQLFAKDFTLRQIEKIYARIRLIMKSINYNQYLFPEIITLLSFLNEKHSNILSKVKNFEYTLQELSDMLDSIIFPMMDVPSKRRFTFLVASFLRMYEYDYSTPYRKIDYGLIDRRNPQEYKLGINSKFNDDSNLLLDALNHYYGQMNTNDVGLSFIIKKFDLTENLKS